MAPRLRALVVLAKDISLIAGTHSFQIYCPLLTSEGTSHAHGALASKSPTDINKYKKIRYII